MAFETNHGKRLVDPAAPVGGRHLAAEDELEGLPHGHVRPEREVLEDHAHAARLGRNQYAAVAARRLVADQDHAPLGRLESGDQPQHGALARTRRADEHRHRPVGNAEIELAEDGLPAVAEVDVLEADEAHRPFQARNVASPAHATQRTAAVSPTISSASAAIAGSGLLAISV